MSAIVPHGGLSLRGLKGARFLSRLKSQVSSRGFYELRRIYSRELVDALFLRPYCRVNNFVEQGIAQRQTAAKYLKLLTEAGLLHVREAGRERLYVNTRLMALLKSDAHRFNEL